MPNINITVAGKIATNTTPGEVIVCGNSDYTVTFTFDGEWTAETTRTARFVYYKDGRNLYQEKVFTGATVAVPVLYDVAYVLVGVYAGDLHTTTPAKVLCDRSILCGSDNHNEPPEDVYLQLLALLSAGGGTGGDVDPDAVKNAVAEYLKENPAQAVAIDTTLTQSGQAADAKAVGEAIANIELTPGPQGEKGDNGADGYTPVKGTDYWTEADKAEMVDAVLAALPAAEEASF